MEALNIILWQWIFNLSATVNQIVAKRTWKAGRSFLAASSSHRGCILIYEDRCVKKAAYITVDKGEGRQLELCVPIDEGVN